jgi:allophanate hydrolase subunit 1
MRKVVGASRRASIGNASLPQRKALSNKLRKYRKSRVASYVDIRPCWVPMNFADPAAPDGPAAVSDHQQLARQVLTRAKEEVPPRYTTSSTGTAIGTGYLKGETR